MWHPAGDLGKLFASLAPIGWIDPISSFVSGRNLCAALVAYLSAIWGNFLLRLLLLVGLIQSARVVAGRNCCKLRAARVAYCLQTFCFVCSHWLDIIGSVQSAALFQVASVAICVRYVSRTCWRFRRADGLQWTAALLH
jgi:hypothetical protein